MKFVDYFAGKREMIFINELLPNPDGKDVGKEWVELFNGGANSQNLNGWFLQNGAGKKFSLDGEITAGGFSVVRTTTKLTIRNADEEISLHDSRGARIDSVKFYGSAPSGKSWSRSPAGSFVWAEPTPGKENSLSGAVAVMANQYPAGVPLNQAISGVEVWLLLAGVAAVLTAAALFIIKRNENLSQLFFGSN